MALFDFLNKKNTPQNNTAQNNLQYAAIWESNSAVFISSQHISGPSAHICCEVKYSHPQKAFVCKTTESNSNIPEYEILLVPQTINTADNLIAFLASNKPWLPVGYKLSEDLKNQLNAVLNGNASATEIKVSEDYLANLKRVAFKYMPDNICAAQLEYIFNLINGLIDLETLRPMLMVTSWQAAQKAEQDNRPDTSALINQAFAQTAFKINNLLDVMNETYLLNKISTANEETLLKAFIAVDFYAYSLKDEFTANLKKLQISIAKEMLKRGFTVVVTQNVSEFEQLQARCNKAQKENPNADETKQLVIELGRKLLTLDEIYVAFDEDFNNKFPFIGTDGRIEVCTTLENAKALVEYYHQQKIGHLSLREFRNEQVVKALESFQQMGICVLRLDNGAHPVDIWFNDILNSIPNNIIEEHNVQTKGELLRELQYGYRFQKMEPAQKDSEWAQSLIDMMLTMRYNAYRAFGNGLCYVLATTPYKPGTTFYSEKALAKVKELIKENNLPETVLISKNDTSYGVYDTTINLRVAQKPGQTMEQAFVCAFTGREEAEMVRTNFLQHGINDSVIVITYDELCSHAMQCAGILIDMPTYGYELLKSDLQDVFKWRDFNGVILIKAKKN